MRLAVAGVKGAPGTTTFAFGLCAALARDGRAGVLVEADPDGGSAGVRLGLSAEPGLASLAAAGRHDLSCELVRSHCQALDEALAVLVAPGAPHQARACLEQLSGRLGSALDELSARSNAVVICDLGRTPASGMGALGPPDGMIWILPPTLEGVDAAAHRIARLDPPPGRAWVVTSGDGPYRMDEIAEHLELSALGALGWEPAAAARLWDGRGESASLRGPLGKSLLAAAATLCGTARPVPAPARRSILRGVVGGAVAQ